jgi:hypothetical protein
MAIQMNTGDLIASSRSCMRLQPAVARAATVPLWSEPQCRSMRCLGRNCGGVTDSVLVAMNRVLVAARKSSEPVPVHAVNKARPLVSYAVPESD